MEAHSQDELWFPSFKSCYNIGANLADIRTRGLEVYIGVDISASGRDGTAVTVVGLERSTSLRYLMEITYGAWRFQDTIKFLGDAVYRYPNIRRIIVENNVMQQALIDDIMVTNAPWRWLVDPFTTTGQNKNHPEVGLAALESEFSKQAWVIPSAEFASHPAVCQCHWCRLIMEINTYPMAATSDGLMSCVTPGSLVTTARGMIPIEQVVEGDTVLTHQSRWRKVTKTMSREYSGEVIRVSPRGRQSFCVTPEHPIWSATSRHTRENRSNRLVPSVWAFKEAKEIKAGRKLEGDYVLVPVPKKWAGGSREAVLGGLPIDEDAATLLGLYLSEGSCNAHQTNFVFHERETHLSFFVRDTAKKLLGANTGIRNRRKCQIATIYTVGAPKFFAPLGRKSHFKALPDEAMSWPLPILMAVVRGWFMGDGCISAQKLSGVSTSAKLIWQVQTILNRAGFAGSWGVFEKGGRNGKFPSGSFPLRKSWHIVMSKTDTARFVQYGSPLEKIHWSKADISEVRERSNSAHLAQEGGYSWRLRGMDREAYTGLVYNMHVEEDESYTVEGVAVHNCWFAWGAIQKWGTSGGKINTSGLNLR